MRKLNIGIDIDDTITDTYYNLLPIIAIKYKMDLSKIRVYQKWSSYGLSFMHGAQDGQKFIGIVILYLSIKCDILGL